ncbi:MAG: galactokinase [Chloroflexi bacterium HGW-Chloroflexi-4]|jgi:galactokinase|nr:MAG: galactokinase [Chloroflexi bacterium HGW-Chloroflexi-4]
MSQKIQIVSPGRVNLLGEHVDKNDGKVLPAAIDRSIKLSAEVRDDSLLKIKALDLSESVEIDLRKLDAKLDSAGRPLPSWAKYPAGVAWGLQSGGFATRGAEVEFTSNIPMGAGLSSSAAVEVAFAVLWQSMSGWAMDRLTLSQYCQKAEVEYAGVNCGLMDQFACANGVEGHAVLLDTRSLDFKSVPLPKNTAIVIADSTIRRSLQTSAYNDRVIDCQAAVSAAQKRNANVVSLREVSVDELEAMRYQLSDGVYRHARHVVGEIERVEQAIHCLEIGDSTTFGKIMFDTHTSLRDLYEVSCPELDALVEIASGFTGCIGARLTGAGFGGCTVNLVEQSKAEEFVNYLSEGYLKKTNLKAAVFVTQASRGAFVV